VQLLPCRLLGQYDLLPAYFDGELGASERFMRSRTGFGIAIWPLAETVTCSIRASYHLGFNLAGNGVGIRVTTIQTSPAD
jgi:hypothetical protein